MSVKAVQLMGDDLWFEGFVVKVCFEFAVKKVAVMDGNLVRVVMMEYMCLDGWNKTNMK